MLEEVIFTAIDSGWNQELPITLITYDEGNMDIHRQTGTDFDKHMAEAEKILIARGLEINKMDFSVGSTGAYYGVRRKR